MRVLVVGSGAREHALVWKLAGERGVSEILCAPGNAGIEGLARCVGVDLGDPGALLALADRELIDFTIVGPELPLSRGVANLFASERRALFGPTREAAELESSKSFAKTFMSRHRVPTARYQICDNADAAVHAIGRGAFGFPVVLKADGLAAGKGVIIAGDRAAAEDAVRAVMVDRQFGEAGARLVVEEHLSGEEASFFVIADGSRAVALPSAQDHKRVFDDDQGPNTGGMGAFAPSPLIDRPLARRVTSEIVRPVLDGLRAEGREFRGFLYVGLMITVEGPKVVEFNVRLGDPEAQVVLPAVDEDLLPLLWAAAAGNLQAGACACRPEAHVGVVLASGGYPGAHEVGKPIGGLEQAARTPDVLVFHAATARRDGRIVTTGGRVLTIVGRGATYAEAIARAYDGASRIGFEGMHYRRDIGQKALL